MVIRKLTLLLLLAGSCSSGDNTPSLPTFDPDALISVSGTMIDVRDVRSGDALYPQNDDFKIPQEFAIAFGSNMHYATTLREYRGVERVSADHPTILRIAVADNTHPGSMWNDSRTSFRIGSLRMHLYTCHYTTPGKWIPVPSGQPNAATLVFGRKITVDGVPPAPGKLIASATELRKRNITNPSIMILSDGSYFVGSSGPDPKGNTYFRSTDKGLSWKKCSNPDYMNFCKCFTCPSDPSTLYEVGISAATRGNIVIRKSSDKGHTWSSLTTLFKGDYHGAPTPFIEYQGRIWHAMGTAPADGKMGITVLSIPIGSDPMRPANWTLTNTLTGDTSWLSGNPDHIFNEWQEGCIVVDPAGKLVVLIRIDDSRTNDLAALVSVTDQRTITFNPATGFCDMPGGGKKFTVRYDTVSGKYWTLANPCYDKDRVRTHTGWYSTRIYPIFLRSRLVLCSSADLRNWTVVKEVISSNNCFFHGFQYTDWEFDGNDIIAVSRTAFPESRGLPIRQHDANMLTFHRIVDFRSAGFTTENITYDQL